jgi:hypothetical protein
MLATESRKHEPTAFILHIAVASARASRNHHNMPILCGMLSMIPDAMDMIVTLLFKFDPLIPRDKYAAILPGQPLRPCLVFDCFGVASRDHKFNPCGQHYNPAMAPCTQPPFRARICRHLVFSCRPRVRTSDAKVSGKREGRQN